MYAHDETHIPHVTPMRNGCSHTKKGGAMIWAHNSEVEVVRSNAAFPWLEEVEKKMEKGGETGFRAASGYLAAERQDEAPRHSLPDGSTGKSRPSPL